MMLWELNKMMLEGKIEMTLDSCVDKARTFGHFLVTQLLVDGLKGAPKGRADRRIIPLAAMHPVLGEYALGPLNSSFRNLTEAPVALAVMPVRISTDDVILSVGMGISEYVRSDDHFKRERLRPVFTNMFFSTLLKQSPVALGNCMNMVGSRDGAAIVLESVRMRQAFSPAAELHGIIPALARPLIDRIMKGLNDAAGDDGIEGFLRANGAPLVVYITGLADAIEVHDQRSESVRSGMPPSLC